MKSKGLFHFKGFSLSDQNSTHKIGTDGVLLGAWVDIREARCILDVGCGSGVITLMLAQRTSEFVKIDAIDINQTDVTQALENVKNSPWPHKITVSHAAFQQWLPSYRYDLIVSNPPYFMNSWLPPDENRKKARHTNELTFEELAGSSHKLLSSDGRLAVVLPPTEADIFKEIANRYEMHLGRSLSFRSRQHKPVERVLMEFHRRHVSTQSENLVLYSEGENWSPEYRTLTKDFYLKA